MTIDAKYVYEGLLRYNYFPMVKEHRDDIAPFFTTADFTPTVADLLISTQNSRGSGSSDPRGRDGFDLIEYRTTRFNNVLRMMHIPHPNAYARLCQCIQRNWDELEHVCDNEVSQIRPDDHGGGRVVVMDDYDIAEMGRLFVMEKEQFPEDLSRHLVLSTGAKYRVEADIASCFPSLYTHSIPWALVGHDKAKKSRGPALWFNRLDSSQRFVTRNETKGVPVGPATSNLMNEIILFPVDRALIDKGYSFVRFIDDYKCYCKSMDMADKFVRDLEIELSRYRLLLNAKKVSVTELPTPFKKSWVGELAVHIPETGKLSARKVARVLDIATAMQTKYRDGSIVKYAARTLARRIDVANATIFSQYLLQLSFEYPVVLPILCEVAKKFIVRLDPTQIREVIARHLQYRRSDAVCWSMYLLFINRGSLKRDLAKRIIESGDCMAMAGMLAADKFTKLICTYVLNIAGSHHYEMDRYWILIYELVSRGNLKKSILGGYYRQTGLDVLSDAGVSFLRNVPLRSLKRKRAR